MLCAQPPRIGILEFYGVRKVPLSRIQKALGVKEGDPLPSSKGATEERLEAVPGVVRAHLEAVCCEDGKAVLFVGVEERLAQHSELRPAPEGGVSLPAEIVEAHQEFIESLENAVRRGDVSEDLSAGHSLMADPACHTAQERFIGLAELHLAKLREVLKLSADADQRVIAADVIGYAPKKKLVVDDLQYALQDSDDRVRNNATRALRAFAVLAEKDPELGIQVSPTWFIEMLNSIVWTDRIKTLATLVVLTDTRKPEVLQQIRERALDSIVEMARWKSLRHALPAYILFGRIFGMPEEQIHASWLSGKREEFITRALEALRRKR